MTLFVGGRTQIGYLVAGMVFGGLWLLHSSDPLWETVLRLLLIMGVVMTLSTAVRHWASRRGKNVPEHSVGRFLIAKLGLLALAVVAGLALDSWVHSADLWIGLGMCVLVAVVGPLIHPWLSGAGHREPASA
ncbi:hypothetical protein BVC93_01090 [Mycobacterium sp. MS1601]|uniref:hypothetical protein n=1 Tax=Mycobacterium sp. MS1601 TaxID=1936029 RepID=UPI0009795775|nr:hypothetical protein [Mycobacterium sp. MS1601]AQA01248.1 hypothetical protein BVC93_01090 [Mycobacterium sp. MS1601]